MSDIKLCLGMQYLKTDVRTAAVQAIYENVPEEIPVYTHASFEKEHSLVWGRRLWECTLDMAKRNRCTHCLFLQEDSVMCPDFWEVLPQMLAAKPEEIISLHTPHWRFEGLYVDGADWVTTYDGLIGNAYVLTVGQLESLLRFMDEDIKEAALSVHSEDGMIATWAMAQRRMIYHPMPSPVDHGKVGPSLYNHDDDLYYRPVVRWNLGGVQWPKTWNKEPVCLGMVYLREHWRLRSYLTPAAVEKYKVIPHMYELQCTAINLRHPDDPNSDH